MTVKELTAETERSQLLKQEVDTLLSENSALERELARLRAMVIVAAAMPAGDATTQEISTILNGVDFDNMENSDEKRGEGQAVSNK
ncbi:hypothetical protein HFP57_17510 [Parasphingopyxis algicola]|uniref:hypothetical protein n=1 Tax=Parasphingopyxis algicola TaxID=2026624 RepID=UPI0015A0908C|nr:hypothetical protein [Parasphingopyxis algicola]QLC26655.1 hypothetical protein HFP57_17510 [Parasphingopyxis algicola]